VAGIEDLEAGVGVGGGEFPGVLHRHDIVVLAVEDERRLVEVRVVLVELTIVEECGGECAVPVLAVMKDFHGAGVAPCRYGIGAHAIRPAAGESESRRE